MLTMKNVLMLIIGTLFLLPAYGQQKEGILNYVAQYKDVAIEEMVRTGIPASITLAQGILESGCGQSDLSVKANNHFGIKCKEEWSGKRFYQDDDAPNECFRVYANARESYADHSDFLLTRSRYADLFKLPAGDYKSWAYGLKAAGYATNPQYAPKLVNYIETYSLHQYDEIGYAMMQKRETLLTAELEKEPIENSSAETVSTKTNPTKLKSNSIREEFLVNGVRAIRAEGDEDPFAIAFEYNIDYVHVLSFNDLNSGDKFKDGENIFLQPKKNRAEINNYTVKEGESVRDISQKFGVKLKDLYYKNLMKPNEQVQAGENIFLQEKRTLAPKTISYAEYLKTVAHLNNVTKQNETLSETSILNNSAYEVQQKDTLYSIAKKFNTTVDKIKEMNNMDNSSIRPGQTLVVSQ